MKTETIFMERNRINLNTIIIKNHSPVCNGCPMMAKRVIRVTLEAEQQALDSTNF